MRLGILIIDDEEGIRRSLTRVLREDGYSVYTAVSGEEALRVVQQNPQSFDIIICDLIMPGIDGIKTIQEINKLKQGATKIMLTGYGTLESSIKAMEAGIDGFITKPFENKELRWKVKEYYLRRTMRQFIWPDIFNELIAEPSRLEPKLSPVTILFSDIRGFTKLTLRTAPESLASLLNKHYFQPMSEIIIRHRGVVDKYIGDSIMALFGAPVYQKNHEENAVRCAIDMVRKMEEANQPDLQMGVGIGTGQVVTGMFGAASKKEYTALGMPVNVAARLQKLAAPGEIIISEETKAKLSDDSPFAKAGSLSFAQHHTPTVYYRWTGNGQV